MSDLIERLRLARRMVAGQHDTATIDEAIEALSTPMPDDVAEMVTDLHIDYARSVGGAASRERKAAHMLERQQRNYDSACRHLEMADSKRDELEQRIEHLEGVLDRLHKDSCKRWSGCALNDEYARAALAED